MASVKKLANPLGDEGSQEAFRTVSVLKGSASDLAQLSKLTRAHHAAMQAAIDSGKVLADHLIKVTQKVESRVGDVSQCLIEISTTEKAIMGLFEDHNNFLLESVSQALQTQLQQERGSIHDFEKGYHKKHSDLVNQVRRAEKDVKKSGKKSPENLKTAIQNLTDKMNEVTNHRQDRLQEILLMERARYCNVLNMWTSVADSQISKYKSCVASLEQQNPRWKEVGQTGTSLPSNCQQLVKAVGVQERTATSLFGGGGDEGYYEGGYYEEGYYEEGYDEGYYEEGYEEGYYEEGYEEAYEESYAAPTPAAAGGSFKARALYDYQGTHDYELSFGTGDIITVTNEDASTGWWTGELNGVVGPFPGNYVQRI